MGDPERKVVAEKGKARRKNNAEKLGCTLVDDDPASILAEVDHGIRHVYSAERPTGT